MLERTLITGSAGALGTYLDFGIKKDRKSLDITKKSQVDAVLDAEQPSVILHLAAMTDVAACEKNPAEAYSANAVGTYNLALGARRIGARMVYVSSAGV